MSHKLANGTKMQSVKSVDIVLVQVYMPTNHDENEIEKRYDEISEILHQEGRRQVNAIVMGDFYLLDFSVRI